MVDNFGKSLFRITLEYNRHKAFSIERCRCIEYGTTDENVLIRKYKSKDDFQNLYIAKGEIFENRVFSIINNFVGNDPDKHGFYIREGGKLFKVSPGICMFDVGDVMLSHADTRIVQTLPNAEDVFIPSIVYDVLHQ